MMSCRRSELSLGGTHGLAENALTQVRFERLPRDQVHWTSEQLLQVPAQACELEQRHRAAELDEEKAAVRGRQLPTAGCEGAGIETGPAILNSRI